MKRWPNNLKKKSLESSLSDYSDAYILVTWNITANPNNTGTCCYKKQKEKAWQNSCVG